MRALDPRLLRRARAVRVLLAFDVTAAAVGAGLLIAQATLVGALVGDAFGGGLPGLPWGPCVALLGVTGVRALLAWCVEVAGRVAATRVLSQLRLDLVRHRLERQPTALDAVESGELAAAVVLGGDGLAAYFGRYLPQVALAIVVPTAVIGWTAIIDLTSALVMLVTVPLVPVFMALVGTYTERRTRQRYATLRLLSTHFLDVVRGLPTLRAFNRGAAQAARIGEVTDAYRRATMDTLRIAFLSGAVLELAATIGTAVIAVTLGVRLVNGGLALAPALTVLMLTPDLYAPLRAVGTQFHAAADGLAVAERMLELLDAPGATPRGGTIAPPDLASATIRFEDVAFTYPARTGEVLAGVDLVLEPGETVAVIGPSGAGKSTLVDLLLGLAGPSRGRILVEPRAPSELDRGPAIGAVREPGHAPGAIDLAGIDLATWRAQLAWLPQRPAIVRGTVAENIRIALPGASEAAVREAARLAGADGFVTLLPLGYGTPIGDAGRTLSTGERRRIALARAFLRDAAVVVLDEPTADLDPVSADAIVDALARLRIGRTVLVVAHDERLPALADRVLRIEGGRIVQVRARTVAGSTAISDAGPRVDAGVPGATS
jgi:ATP-binding cassette subfamily C protein CydD